MILDLEVNEVEVKVLTSLASVTATTGRKWTLIGNLRRSLDESEAGGTAECEDAGYLTDWQTQSNCSERVGRTDAYLSIGCLQNAPRMSLKS